MRIYKARCSLTSRIFLRPLRGLSLRVGGCVSRAHRHRSRMYCCSSRGRSSKRMQVTSRSYASSHAIVGLSSSRSQCSDQRCGKYGSTKATSYVDTWMMWMSMSVSAILIPELLQSHRQRCRWRSRSSVRSVREGLRAASSAHLARFVNHGFGTEHGLSRYVLFVSPSSHRSR